jgi:hypothetical protein
MKSVKVYFVLALVFVLALSLTLTLKDPAPVDATGVSKVFFNNTASQPDAGAQTVNLGGLTMPSRGTGQ